MPVSRWKFLTGTCKQIHSMWVNINHRSSLDHHRALIVNHHAIAAVPNQVSVAAPITAAAPSSTTMQDVNQNNGGIGPKGRGRGRGRGKGKSSAVALATRATRSRVTRQTAPLPVDSELELDEDGL